MRVALFISFFFISSLAFSQYNYPKLNYGDSYSKVKTEYLDYSVQAIQETDTSLTYQADLWHVDSASVTLIFRNDKLYCFEYRIYNVSERDFTKALSKEIKRYGKPLEIGDYLVFEEEMARGTTVSAIKYDGSTVKTYCYNKPFELVYQQ